MKKSFGLMLLAAAFLAACGDGVPRVDDPHHPVDRNGTAMKGTDFLQKYCMGKQNNETCAKVQQAVNTDSTKGGLPKGY